MATTLQPSLVALPACCPKPVHSINDTTAKGECLKCGARFTFDREKGTWSADPKPKESK